MKRYRLTHIITLSRPLWTKLIAIFTVSGALSVVTLSWNHFTSTGISYPELSSDRDVAAIPPHSKTISDDTELYQRLSEINVPKTSAVDFDADIHQLRKKESQHREKLPSLSGRVRTPMKRIDSRTQ